MGNILNFPTKSVRDWLLIEGTLSDVLQKSGASLSAQTRVIEKMKVFYEAAQVDLNFTINATFPENISEAQKAAVCSEIGDKVGAILSERLQAFTNKLMIERLYREIDACSELGIL